jgi:hypothetical protein
MTPTNLNFYQKKKPTQFSSIPLWRNIPGHFPLQDNEKNVDNGICIDAHGIGGSEQAN